MKHGNQQDDENRKSASHRKTRLKVEGIPFKKEPIFDAINQFSVVNSKYPKGGALGYYSEEAYKSLGIV